MADQVGFPIPQDQQPQQQPALLPPIQARTASPSLPTAPFPMSMPGSIPPGVTMPAPMSVPMVNHSQGQAPTNLSNGMTPGQEDYYGLDSATANMHHPPTSAQAGLQYSALASITSTDSGEIVQIACDLYFFLDYNKNSVLTPV